MKITVKEPIEIDDDVFIKYLIVFKKWLAIEESSEDKEDVRSAFLSQAKPRKTFRWVCMNGRIGNWRNSFECKLKYQFYSSYTVQMQNMRPICRLLRVILPTIMCWYWIRNSHCNRCYRQLKPYIRARLVYRNHQYSKIENPMWVNEQKRRYRWCICIECILV